MLYSGSEGLAPARERDCEFPFSPLAVTGPAVPLGSGGGGRAAGRPEGAAGRGPGKGSAGEPVPSLFALPAPKDSMRCLLMVRRIFPGAGLGAFLFSLC